MRTLIAVFGGVALGLAVVAATQAHEDMKDLPEGPIRERHELMEEIGRNAKIIGDAMKAGDTDLVGGPATKIAEASKKVAVLFPEGTLHPKSRAMATIWEKPAVFAAEMKKLEDTAVALARAADEQKDVGQAANEMFAACKSCHTDFRLPEK